MRTLHLPVQLMTEKKLAADSGTVGSRRVDVSVRQRILGATFGAPDRWWHLSELADALGSTPSSLQRELDSLTPPQFW